MCSRLTFGVLLVGLYLVYLRRPNDIFIAKVLNKEEEEFTVMGAANTVQSRTVMLLKDNAQSVTVTVMDPTLFEKMKIGDEGRATTKGDLLISFEKS